jgi:hypothetical protein
MTKRTKREAAIPNPALKALSVLVGEWNVVATHRLIPDTLHGHASFEWLEGGAFLMMYLEIEEPGIPSAVAILGSDDVTEEYFMLYFDERGVSRKYDMTLHDNIWTYWRNVSGFSQRFTGTFADEGNIMNGIAELSEDNLTWKRDLELTYTRVK